MNPIMTITIKGEEETVSKIPKREDNIPMPILPMSFVVMAGRKKRRPKNMTKPKETMIVSGIRTEKEFPELLLV